MARVPITVMGFRCERCSHEWIPRGSTDEEPRECPKCGSPYWNRPRKSLMTYDTFREKVVMALSGADRPLTWTEIRTVAGLPQLFPNNQWVHALERDIGLLRARDGAGVIHWQLTKQEGDATHAPAAETPKAKRPRTSRKQAPVE
jgi:hypothetical protein